MAMDFHKLLTKLANHISDSVELTADVAHVAAEPLTTTLGTLIVFPVMHTPSNALLS